MKKILIPLTGLLAIAFYSKAQNTSPYWSLTGNNNAATSSKLGTTNSIPLRLLTKNTERIRIDTFGRVGIGTTTPAQVLHVAGNSTFTGNVGIGTTSPSQKLHVVGGPDTAIYGSSSSGIAVYGNNSNSSGTGVRGDGYIGAQGYCFTLNGFGVFGNYFVSTGNGSGVYGISNSSSGYGVRGINGPTTGSGIGVYGFSYGSTGTGVAGYGFNGLYGQSNKSNGYGVYGTGTTGVYGTGTTGVSGKASSSSGYGIRGENTSSVGTGVYGTGYWGVYGISNNNTGVYGGSSSSAGEGVMAYNNNGSGGYGVWSSGFTGIYAEGETGVRGYTFDPNGNYAGYFDGNVYTTGTYEPSDRKLKKNISNLTSVMDIINKLQPKTYEYRQDGTYKLMNLPQGKQYGLIAQDLEQVLPDLIKETEFKSVKAAYDRKPISEEPQQGAAREDIINYKALNYTKLIPLMIKAMQEQDAENKKLKQELTELKSMVEKLAMAKNGVINLSGGYLSQNIPNPFGKSTIIPFYVPEGSRTASIVITQTGSGKVVKTIPVSTTASQITLEIGSLATGIYTYTLLIDGKGVDTKQMVINN